MRLRLLLGPVVCLLAALASCTRSPARVNFIAEGRPERLSEWHVLDVADGRPTPNAGVLPYGLVTPLFSDDAHKLRTVWMPAGVAASYVADKTFDFPVGTILSKTFYYPLRRAQREPVRLVPRHRPETPRVHAPGSEGAQPEPFAGLRGRHREPDRAEGVQLIRDWISAMPGHCQTDATPKD